MAAATYLNNFCQCFGVDGKTGKQEQFLQTLDSDNVYSRECQLLMSCILNFTPMMTKPKRQLTF